MNYHRALACCLRMISAQTLRVCREGKPLHTFPDHALGNRFLFSQIAPGATCVRSTSGRGLCMAWPNAKKKENARGERAFSTVNLGVVGGLKYPRNDFGGL